MRSVGLLYEKNMMQNKALRYYLILVNNTLNQAENDVENSEDDDEPELKPEGEKKIPFENEIFSVVVLILTLRISWLYFLITQ